MLRLATWKPSIPAAIGSLILTVILACKTDEEPALVEADTPQTYGRCGEQLEDCMPAPNSLGGCSEYYTAYDSLEDMPIGPWWTVCQPYCAVDADCPAVADSTAEPRCHLDEDDADGEGACQLVCDAASECPQGMECPEARHVCMWPGAS